MLIFSALIDGYQGSQIFRDIRKQPPAQPLRAQTHVDISDLSAPIRQRPLEPISSNPALDTQPRVLPRDTPVVARPRTRYVVRPYDPKGPTSAGTIWTHMLLKHG